MFGRFEKEKTEAELKNIIGQLGLKQDVEEFSTLNCPQKVGYHTLSFHCQSPRYVVEALWTCQSTSLDYVWTHL